MYAVGCYLSKKALALPNTDSDAFARSALKRYYCRALLTIQEIFSIVKSDWPEWKGNKHSYTDRDAFARSAFNRHYYGAILTIKEMFLIVKPELWNSKRGKQHARYPTILENEIISELEHAKYEATQLDEFDLVDRIDLAIIYTRDLSNKISNAVDIRNAADYEPNEKVVFTENNQFKLKSVSISEAREWGEFAKSTCEMVRNILKSKAYEPKK